jgi:hypothetical protein
MTAQTHHGLPEHFIPRSLVFCSITDGLGRRYFFALWQLAPRETFGTVRHAFGHLPDRADASPRGRFIAMITSPSETPRRSFDPPQEAEWHRMIAEAAYDLALKRGFRGEHSVDDWLAAEQQIRQVISPVASPVAASEETMKDTGPRDQPKPASTPLNADNKGEKPGNPGKRETLSKATRGRSTAKPQESSRFEKFASTQAAGDGIQGDVLKPNKTAAEKIGANMADRK